MKNRVIGNITPQKKKKTQFKNEQFLKFQKEINLKKIYKH